MVKYLVTTRPEEKNNTGVTSRCFDIVNVPVTKLVANYDIEPTRIEVFKPSIAIFTSSYGARLALSQFMPSLDNKVKIVAIGNRTATVLREKYPSVLVPEEMTSAGVVALLNELVTPRDRIALFVSSKSNRVIEQYLAERNIEYIREDLYYAENLPGEEFRKTALGPDCFGVILTSSHEASVVFRDLLNKEEIQRLLLEKRIFSIGATTSATLSSLRIAVSEPVGKSDLKSLVEEIDRLYCPAE